MDAERQELVRDVKTLLEVVSELHAVVDDLVQRLAEPEIKTYRKKD